MVELRDYQRAAVDAVLKEWGGFRSTLLSMATGTGKTTVFGEIARRRLDGGVLVLAHRDELITQAAGRLGDMCGCTPEIEKADMSYTGESGLCIASVQTLQRERLDRFPVHDFGTVIIDEAHHSVAGTYRSIIDATSHAKLLGVTATSDRADNRALAEVYDSIAYEYGLAQAVKDGWLSPIRAKFVPLELDITDVKVSHGDYQVSDLGDALAPYIPKIAKVMSEECVGRKTICFLPLVATAERMAEALNAAGLRSECVSGYDSKEERRAKLAAFEDGNIDVICNSMLITEGYDCPAVDCVVVLRPTRSRALYAQMVGRGTRTAPGKDHLLLLDFLWQTERHDLARPASLFGRAERERQIMCNRLQESQESTDLMELAQEAETSAQAEREAALAEMLAAQRRRKKKLVDPLRYAVSVCSADLTDYQPVFAWQKKSPTDKQKAALDRFGIDSACVETRGMASALLDECIRRSDMGLASAKQIRFLENKGYEHVGTWTKEQASYAIGRISGNNWTIPYDMKPGMLESSAPFLSRRAAS